MSTQPFFRSICALIPAVTAALFLAGCGSDSGPPGMAFPPLPVTVAVAEKGSVTVEQTYAGRVRGAREVEVRTRVQGILQQRLHAEGRAVRKGQALFRIDPEPFTVALQAARAEEQSAAADLGQAEREWQRVSRLYEQDAVSQRERDTARSALELAEARLALTRARTAQAQLELGYTRVEAPLAGITSLEVVPEGSLVERGTLLTTIVQHDPVHVRIAIPEADAAWQRRARLAMAGGRQSAVQQAVLLLPDGSIYERSGDIDFTASSVDPGTGTVTARAVFANPDRLLVPGQFVRLRVPLQTLDDVVLVPAAAILEGPDGPSLYVVDENSQAQLRRVTLGPLTGGGQVLLAGVEEGERVVINGQVALRPGAPVQVQSAAQESR